MLGMGLGLPCTKRCGRGSGAIGRRTGKSTARAASCVLGPFGKECGAFGVASHAFGSSPGRGRRVAYQSETAARAGAAAPLQPLGLLPAGPALPGLATLTVVCGVAVAELWTLGLAVAFGLPWLWAGATCIGENAPGLQPPARAAMTAVNAAPASRSSPGTQLGSAVRHVPRTITARRLSAGFMRAPPFRGQRNAERSPRSTPAAVAAREGKKGAGGRCRKPGGVGGFPARGAPAGGVRRTRRPRKGGRHAGKLGPRVHWRDGNKGHIRAAVLLVYSPAKRGLNLWRLMEAVAGRLLVYSPATPGNRLRKRPEAPASTGRIV